jgi:hypothetical protein
MNHFPISIPTQNTHRVVLLLPQLEKSDLDRVEHIAADALAMTRDALLCLSLLPDPILREITTWHCRLAKELEHGRVLGETFRHCAQTILQRLSPAAEAAGHRDQLDAALGKLQDALKL